MTTLQKTILAAGLGVIVGIGFLKLRPATKTPHRTIVAPRPAPVLHLPPPRVTPAPPEPPPPVTAAAVTETTNRLAKLMSGELSRLTAQQAEAYVQAKGRTAAALLAAFKASGELDFLREAMQRFPNDPQVAFAAVVSGKLSADEQRQWLDAFAKAAPDNAVPNYLSALAWFNAGDSGKAAEELLAAAGKKGFQDYTMNSIAGTVEAYRSAGYSEVEALVAANFGLPLSLATNLRQLGKDIISLADGYQQAGDPGSAQSAIFLAATLGQYYADSSNLIIQKLIGLAIESSALKTLPADTTFGANGQTVQDELNQIAQQRNLIKQLVQQTSNDFSAMPNWPNEDLAQYFAILQQNGEVAAMQWLVARNTNH